MLLAVAGAVVAGPLEDAVAAVNKRDYATALRLLRPLAEQGDDVAQFDLGVMYNEGWGVSRDYLQAWKWYRRAAIQGNADAQFNLGMLYERHRYTEAAKWYREAADQGLEDAQLNLGLLYAKGQGVPRDDVQAYMWFELSAAQGDQSAANNRDAAAQRMTPEQIAEAQKLAHEWRPKPER
jgi:TPR repeat protein